MTTKLPLVAWVACRSSEPTPTSARAAAGSGYPVPGTPETHHSVNLRSRKRAPNASPPTGTSRDRNPNASGQPQKSLEATPNAGYGDGTFRSWVQGQRNRVLPGPLIVLGPAAPRIGVSRNEARSPPHGTLPGPLAAMPPPYMITVRNLPNPAASNSPADFMRDTVD